ncbi:uncharacterized protein MELLADRAFT_93330 [Melampsora larici-populina 98AG31]|uniref:Prefoldin subunit 4 n=1 Tax=Melampsora larici-populina (strain 98AG31 / pathotype 3-4-7) TaxID=747676 RepID=F4S4T2_MELLP|nr:uncharacterized protein MELLADRAFT_93330 [Melampsora larici-populina 98AG31]EGG00342.1 hypothetical protein MELLADRAFT_93330 [Melampsora larici-populina 98AG31]
MRMLHSSAADEPEVEVNQADQANINRFSNLNVQYEELEAKLQAKKDELDYLSELETDLMMLDDDELVMYKLETSLVHMTPAKATELNERNQKKLSDTVDRLQADLEKCDEEMSQLKKLLYKKFGNTINLERNEPA